MRWCLMMLIWQDNHIQEEMARKVHGIVRREELLILKTAKTEGITQGAKIEGTDQEAGIEGIDRGVGREGTAARKAEIGRREGGGIAQGAGTGSIGQEAGRRPIPAQGAY